MGEGRREGIKESFVFARGFRVPSPTVIKLQRLFRVARVSYSEIFVKIETSGQLATVVAVDVLNASCDTKQKHVPIVVHYFLGLESASLENFGIFERKRYILPVAGSTRV